MCQYMPQCPFRMWADILRSGKTLCISCAMLSVLQKEEVLCIQKTAHVRAGISFMRNPSGTMPPPYKAAMP